MTTPTGTALLAQASAEDLERDAANAVEVARWGEGDMRDEVKASLLRLSALARAVAVCESGKKLVTPGPTVGGGFTLTYARGTHPTYCAALADLLGGEDV